jgi:site-specific DNA recombinase
MTEYTQAIIYCRVSSERQVTTGHGLDSQEFRCRERARLENLEVVKVFRDEGISGGLFERPAMQDLLKFLDKHPLEKYVIIFDDLARFARDLNVHLQLRAELKSRDCKLLCLNFNIEDSPEGEYAENISASSAQYERRKNQRQVIQKMTARVTDGYWAFCNPLGMKFTTDHEKGGKVLVPNEPYASIYREAIEKFSRYELGTLEETRIFILNKYQEHGIDRKLSIHGTVAILTKPLYGGFIKCEKWNVPLIKGRHVGLVHEDVYHAILERLNKSAKPRLRKDINLDFLLRNYLLCPACLKPYTGSWHSGRHKNYPYYWCKTKGCKNRHLTIPRDKAEADFVELLKKLIPDKKILKLAEAILKDLWNKKQVNAAGFLTAKNNEIKIIETKIQTYLNRIGKTANEETVKIYEEQITKLTVQKRALENELTDKGGLKTEFGTALSVVMKYLENPVNIWQKADYKKKRLLLSVYFQQKIAYDRNSGFGTAVLPNVIKLITEKSNVKKPMVEMPGVKPGSKTCSSSNFS